MKISHKNVDYLFFYIVLADLLFFPYIRVLSISSSMVLVPLWFLIRRKGTYYDKEDMFCLLAIVIAITSYILGILSYSEGVFLRDGSFVSPASSFLPNTVIIIFSFLYFMFFKQLIIKYAFSINRILAFYFIFIFILCSIYFYNVTLFFNIRSFWTLSNIVVAPEELSSISRFTSTMSDPNNFSSIINAVLAFVLITDNINKKYKLLSIVLTFFFLIGSMSSTGFVTFALIVFIYLFNDIFCNIKSIKSIISSLVFLFSSIIAFISIFIYIKSTEVGKLAFERVESNSLDSRLDIWTELFDFRKLISSVFYGDGGLVIINQKTINPHNGHFHLIYSYGFIFYIIFLLIFFRKRKQKNLLKHLFIIPIFIGFTVNVGVYELRFVGMMALLTATLYYKNYRYKNIGYSYRVE